MTIYTFNLGDEGWSTTDLAHDAADGYPANGCLSFESGTPFEAKTTTITGLSIVIGAGGTCAFATKYTGFYSAGFGIRTLDVTYVGGTPAPGAIGDTGSFPVAASGVWGVIEGGGFAAGTIETITFNISGLGNALTGIWLDTVCINSAFPTVTVIPETRYLGMDADSENLYLTSIEGGTLTFKSFPLTTLTPAGTATFGTAAYTDPDTYSRAIYPAVRGMSDGVVYLYGRDANDVQVQYNDTNGTAGWTDVGAGTIWANKFCVSLMPSAYSPNSVIAAFADDDIYHTKLGTMTWTKTGDAGTALRTAARVTTELGKIITAGQGTAQMYYSQNLGVSFTNAFSGVAGTVNSIEVSR